MEARVQVKDNEGWTAAERSEGSRPLLRKKENILKTTESDLHHKSLKSVFNHNL